MPLDTKETTAQSAKSSSGIPSTLPGRDYHAPEIFELERERIFHDKWVCVGREEQVANAGDYLAREIIDESVVSDHVMTYRLQDITPERTTVVSEFLFEQKTIEKDDFDPKDIVNFWDLVSRQDWAVCERVQKGVRSRAYQSGVYPPNDQFALEFNQRYLQERGMPR